MVEIIDFVQCHIKNRSIDICECLDIQNVVDNSVDERVIDFNLSATDRQLCLNCKKE